MDLEVANMGFQNESPIREKSAHPTNLTSYSVNQFELIRDPYDNRNMAEPLRETNSYSYRKRRNLIAKP